MTQKSRSLEKLQDLMLIIFLLETFTNQKVHNIHNYMCGISVVCVYTYNFVCTPVYIVHVCMCIYVILCICV